MNSVNANWTSGSAHPLPSRSGCTNNVQEYCRFAIMIIAINDATSWNQRLFSINVLLPLELQPRLGAGLSDEFHTRIHGADGRHRHAKSIAELDHRANDGF